MHRSDSATAVAYLGNLNYGARTLISCKRGRYIQATCATSGEGLYEGLDWLSAELAKSKG